MPVVHIAILIKLANMRALAAVCAKKPVVVLAEVCLIFKALAVELPGGFWLMALGGYL